MIRAVFLFFLKIAGALYKQNYHKTDYDKERQKVTHPRVNPKTGLSGLSICATMERKNAVRQTAEKRCP